MSTEPMNPEELLSRAVDGDTNALGKLFAIHQPRLQRMAHLRLDPRLAGRVGASDVIQDVGLEAIRRFQEYATDREVPFFVWLRFLTHQRLNALARHHLGVEARDVRRELRIIAASSASVTSAALAEQLLGKHTAPSLAAHRAEQKRMVEEALSKMDDLDRDVLSLRHFEHLSNVEAATELGMEESATSKRYIRALKKLKTILAGIPGAPGGAES